MHSAGARQRVCASGVSEERSNTAPIPSEGLVEGSTRDPPYTLAANGHQDGLSHSGEPADDEVSVIEEPETPGESGPHVMRAPRVPTQKEIDAHMATHIPHEEWCDFCMSGRARNKP